MRISFRVFLLSSCIYYHVCQSICRNCFLYCVLLLKYQYRRRNRMSTFFFFLVLSKVMLYKIETISMKAIISAIFHSIFLFCLSRARMFSISSFYRSEKSQFISLFSHLCSFFVNYAADDVSSRYRTFLIC